MALLNKSLLAKYSPLPINYNFDEVMLYQPIAISIWVRPILGDAFTDELEYEVANNQVSEVNSTLMTSGGLLQYLSYAMCLQALPFVWAHVSEVGITKGKSEFSDSLDLKDMTYIEASIRRTVETLKDSLIKWLNEHCDSFPLYTPTNCNNSCCSTKGLNSPQPLFEIYSTKKRNTDLK